MKILIIGSKGNLGTQLMRVFDNGQNEVVGWDREDVDVTNKIDLEKQIMTLKPEIIINAVAYNAVDKCEEDEIEFQKAKELNFELIKNLASISQEIKAKFVHYSTDYVFNQSEPAKEDDQPEPINKYAQSKLMGEKALLDCPDLKYYLVRTSKLFGPKGGSELAKPSFFDAMLKLSQTQPELKVVDDEKSCFTYTPDLARATKKLVESQKDYGIYHIINSDPVTWYEGAKALFEISGKNVKVKSVSSSEFPRPAKRPSVSILQNTKLPALRSYKKALEEYIQGLSELVIGK